jgi:hypothetical protein
VQEELDLLVDSTAQRVIPRDPRGMVAEIEWTGAAVPGWP